MGTGSEEEGLPVDSSHAGVLEAPAPPPRSIFDPWRDLVVSPWPWLKAQNQAGSDGTPAQGEAGGLYVTNDAMSGRRAYMKPLKRSSIPGQERAVREKIVSDLAHDLRVRVPPVLLHTRTECPSDQERFTCVSLVLHRTQWTWGMLRNVIMDGRPEDTRSIVMAALPKAAARALGLNTWVEQFDHGGRDGGGHPSNILFGYTPPKPEAGEFVFLDYAWSLGFAHPSYLPDGWKKTAWKRHPAPLFPAYMARFMDRRELGLVIDDIEQYPDEKISALVESMPVSHLPAEQRDLIIEGLIGRKRLVRELLAHYQEEST